MVLNFFLALASEIFKSYSKELNWDSRIKTNRKNVLDSHSQKQKFSNVKGTGKIFMCKHTVMLNIKRHV